jgi:hypothetical protein
VADSSAPEAADEEIMVRKTARSLMPCTRAFSAGR